MAAVAAAPAAAPWTQNPYLPSPDAWNLPASRGFESMAMTPDRRRLYPVNGGALRTDPDPRRRMRHLRRMDANGYLEKTLVLDLLHIADPNGVSLPARPGEYGVGQEFSFPLQSVESVEVLGGQRLLIANDNNYPGSDGRWIARDRPDDTELIILPVPGLR